ncbi:hypothetical protein C8J28_1214 [Cereibacter azotoformans]|uniref:Uncharacterized protein n=1 Tax=Cereibacter azotoformans TaxID=43057 RepID=A0A2T5JTP3_9RHOB|nr:hypothetical protein C8J28_1214 [Cereibacter azotoformans]
MEPSRITAAQWPSSPHGWIMKRREPVGAARSLVFSKGMENFAPAGRRARRQGAPSMGDGTVGLRALVALRAFATGHEMPCAGF